VVGREQVLDFRLAGTHLSERLPVQRSASPLSAGASDLGSLPRGGLRLDLGQGGLLKAAALGLQDTPPGSAALAAHARVEGLTPEALDAALARDKALVQVWAMRAAPYVAPTADLAVFTAGLRPSNESERLYFIRGATAHLARFGLTATTLVEAVAEALPEVLDDRALTKEALGQALAQVVGPRLAPRRLADWNAPDGLRDNRYGVAGAVRAERRGAGGVILPGAAGAGGRGSAVRAPGPVAGQTAAARRARSGAG
jgi:hypothetical protein